MFASLLDVHTSGNTHLPQFYWVNSSSVSSHIFLLVWNLFMLNLENFPASHCLLTNLTVNEWVGLPLECFWFHLHPTGVSTSWHKALFWRGPAHTSTDLPPCLFDSYLHGIVSLGRRMPKRLVRDSRFCSQYLTELPIMVAIRLFLLPFHFQ